MRARPLIVSLLLLAGCGPRAENPAVSELLNAEVRLQRGEHRDSATVDVTLHEPGTIVALVDESGVDVALNLRDKGSLDPGSGSAVESNLEGEGLEIATLEITRPTTVTITIDGPRDWPEAGRVKLSVTAYPARAQRDARSEAVLEGYREWSLGSGRNIASDRVISDVLPHIDRAISAFAERGAESARMAAHARLLRARTLYFHETDWRGARADAARAADEFVSLPVPDLLNAARARRLEAAALQEISFDRTARDPSAAEADAESREILRMLTASGSHLDNVGMARSFNLLGIADLSVHQWSAARTSLEAAVRRYEEAVYRPGIMQSRRNLAVLATSRGDLPLAEKLFADCLRDVAWLEEPDLRASLYNNAGAAAANIGASDAAIERFLLAAQLAREHNLRRAEGRAMHGLGLEYYHRGDLPQAGVLLEQALAIRESINDGPGLYASYRAVGTLRRLAGDLLGARERHLKSLARAPNVVAGMMVRIELALDEKSLGNRRAAIRFLREAVSERLETASHPVMADAQLALAELLLAAPADAASLGEAEAQIARALETAKKSEDILLEINARRVLALAAVANGERGTARTQLERTIRLSLKYRRFSSSGELQASALAGQHQVFQDYITLLMAGSTRQSSPHAASADELNALRVLETIRATMFATSRIGDTRSGELDAALLTLAAKRNSIATLLERSTPPAVEIVKLQQDAANLRARIDRLRAGAAGSSEFASEEPDQLASRLRATVAGHAHLSYLVGDKSSYVWERTTEGTRVWILPFGATALSKRVASLSGVNRLQNPAAFDAKLEELSSVLMPAGLGGPGASSFQIVADGVLADVPFSGLRSPSQPTRRLIDTHSIVMVTSGTFVQQKSKASRRWQLVAIADSPDTSDLPAASSEIRRIATRVPADRMKLIGGSKASAAQVEALLREGIDVLHVATHGHADAQQPLASRLVLHKARGALPDTYVTAGQIQEWEGSVGLVFLSACDTAVGQVRFGDTVPGLQRAFLRAGAHEVIATLWPIEDRLAEEFAISFYEARAAGLESAEALARTQRAWAASENFGDAQIRMRRRVAAWAYALYVR